MKLAKMLDGAVIAPKDQSNADVSREIVNSNVLLGLEFEFEGVGRFTEAELRSVERYYEVVPDGSLREGGQEFRFRRPWRGVTVVSAVRDLLAIGKDKGWATSKRCGLHVHMNVMDLDAKSLSNMLTLYALLEPAIFEWVRDERAANIFCVPWYREPGVYEAVTQVFRELIAASRGAESWEKSGRKRSFLANAERAPKYSSLNLKPIKTQGTIEFRHMRNTLTYQRVIDWINIILKLREFSLEPNVFDRSVDDAINKHTYLQLLKDSSLTELVYPNLDNDVNLLTLDTCKEWRTRFSRTHNPWVDYMSKIPKRAVPVAPAPIPKKPQKGEPVLANTIAARTNAGRTVRFYHDDGVVPEWHANLNLAPANDPPVHVPLVDGDAALRNAAVQAREARYRNHEQATEMFETFGEITARRLPQQIGNIGLSTAQLLRSYINALRRENFTAHTRNLVDGHDFQQYLTLFAYLNAGHDGAGLTELERREVQCDAFRGDLRIHPATDRWHHFSVI